MTPNLLALPMTRILPLLTLLLSLVIGAAAPPKCLTLPTDAKTGKVAYKRTVSSNLGKEQIGGVFIDWLRQRDPTGNRIIRFTELADCPKDTGPSECFRVWTHLRDQGFFVSYELAAERWLGSYVIRVKNIRFSYGQARPGAFLPVESLKSAAADSRTCATRRLVHAEINGNLARLRALLNK